MSSARLCSFLVVDADHAVTRVLALRLVPGSYWPLRALGLVEFVVIGLGRVDTDHLAPCVCRSRSLRSSSPGHMWSCPKEHAIAVTPSAVSSATVDAVVQTLL